MSTYKIIIRKDNSGETFEYIIYKEDDILLMGDGFETTQEIVDWLSEMKYALVAELDFIEYENE